ncbi:MAG: hypothetical protein WBQ03_07920 [Candidatus Sulfotelmatobacter sp.]
MPKTGYNQEDEGTTTDIGNQSLRLIIEPFLISKTQANDDYQRTKEMVVKVFLENAELNQTPDDEIHNALY